MASKLLTFITGRLRTASINQSSKQASKQARRPDFYKHVDR